MSGIKPFPKLSDLIDQQCLQLSVSRSCTKHMQVCSKSVLLRERGLYCKTENTSLRSVCIFRACCLLQILFSKRHQEYTMLFHLDTPSFALQRVGIAKAGEPCPFLLSKNLSLCFR